MGVARTREKWLEAGAGLSVGGDAHFAHAATAVHSIARRGAPHVWRRPLSALACARSRAWTCVLARARARARTRTCTHHSHGCTHACV
eukprot:1461616-Pleurochrysis_carterae.AAC.1